MEAPQSKRRIWNTIKSKLCKERQKIMLRMDEHCDLPITSPSLSDNHSTSFMLIGFSGKRVYTAAGGIILAL